MKKGNRKELYKISSSGMFLFQALQLLIDIFHIEEDEWDTMLDILMHVEDLNGDGYPLVKIYTL